MIDKQSDWEVRLRIILKSFYEDMISIDIDTGKYIKNERDTLFMHPRWTKEDYSSAWKAVSYRSTIEEITRAKDMLNKKDKVMEIASLFPESSMTAEKYNQIKNILESK